MNTEQEATAVRVRELRIFFSKTEQCEPVGEAKVS